MKILRKEFLSDDAMAGAFAGAFARLISAPFDVCDNLSVVIVYVFMSIIAPYCPLIIQS